MKSRHGTWKTDAMLWKKIRPVSANMRVQPTDAERIFWEAVKGKKLNGFKVRRQHPIDHYIVDFFVPAKRLVIELDGGIHRVSVDADQTREDRLRELGCDILRFRNEEIEKKLDEVLEKVRENLES